MVFIHSRELKCAYCRQGFKLIAMRNLLIKVNKIGLWFSVFYLIMVSLQKINICSIECIRNQKISLDTNLGKRERE